MTDERYWAAKRTRDEIDKVENMICYVEDPLMTDRSVVDIDYLIDLFGGSSNVKELLERKKENLERRFEQL